MAVLFASLLGDALVVAIAIATVVALYVRHKFAYWRRLGIAELTPSFPFGNFMPTLLQRISVCYHIDDLYRASTDACVGLWTGLQPTLMMCDAELIRTVLIKDFTAFQDRGTYMDEERDPMSANLFGLPGDKWRHMRHTMSPGFTSGKLKAMFQTLVDCGTPLDRHMRGQADAGAVVEMRELISQFTTNIIASVVFGLDVDCIADPETPFRHYGRKVLKPSLRNGIRGVAGLFFPSLMPYLRLKTVDDDVTEFFTKVVAQNLELRESGAVTRKDFMQLIVQMRNAGVQEDGVWTTRTTGKGEQDKQLTIDQCASQLLLFFVAGFETSSTTMAFALYELAKNVEIQRRVQQEIDEVLARHDGQMTYESVNEMKYLEWCIDETLRKYPPLPVLNRVCTQKWTIPNSGGRTIEAGTPIIIPVYGVHQDPKYYPEPERFEPERFSPERMSGRGFLEQPYMPFGEGPRNCIGSRLGKMQSKVGLVVLLRRFSYELTGNTLKPLVMSAGSVFLSPEGGVNLRVSHRATE